MVVGAIATSDLVDVEMATFGSAPTATAGHRARRADRVHIEESAEPEDVNDNAGAVMPSTASPTTTANPRGCRSLRLWAGSADRADPAGIPSARPQSIFGVAPGVATILTRMSDRHDEKKARARVPLLPLRDIVVFPHMVVPLFVGREKSISALEEAMAKGAATRRSSSPRRRRPRPTSRSPDDIFAVGTIGTIIQLLRLPDGTVKVLVEGKRRARIRKLRRRPTSFFLVEVEELARAEREVGGARSADALGARDLRELRQAEQAHPARDADLACRPSTIPARLADTIVAALPLKLADKQAILETESPTEAAREALRADAGGDRDPAGREEDPDARQEADGEDAEGVLPQRADAGDPEGARRARRVQERDPGARRAASRTRTHVEGGAGQGQEGAQEAQDDGADVAPRRPSCATTSTGCWRCPGTTRPQDKLDVIEAEKILDEDHYGLQEGQGAHPRVPRGAGAGEEAQGADPVPRRTARRRQDVAGASRSPRRPGATSCACRSAACATRRRSAATGARTSARCRARSSSR